MKFNKNVLNLYKIKNYFAPSLLKIYSIKYNSKQKNSKNNSIILPNKTLKQFFYLSVYKNIMNICNSHINYIHYNNLKQINILLTKKKNLNFIFEFKFYSQLQLKNLKNISFIKNFKKLFLLLVQIRYKVFRIYSYKILKY